MSAPGLDSPPGTGAGRRRRRLRLLLVVGALAVVAGAVGTSLAVALRPVAHPVPAVAAGPPAADQAPDPAKEPAARPDEGVAADPAALADGDHNAYITRVDGAGGRIVVDVVQVFLDARAVRAAVADGKPPSEARYLTTWVRNQDPRLRSLPLAGDLQIRLRDACGDPGDDRQVLLARLAADARQDGTYYYTLTLRDGRVHRIQERLAVNAC